MTRQLPPSIVQYKNIPDISRPIRDSSNNSRHQKPGRGDSDARAPCTSLTRHRSADAQKRSKIDPHARSTGGTRLRHRYESVLQRKKNMRLSKPKRDIVGKTERIIYMRRQQEEGGGWCVFFWRVFLYMYNSPRNLVVSTLATRPAVLAQISHHLPTKR